MVLWKAIAPEILIIGALCIGGEHKFVPVKDAKLSYHDRYY